MVDFHLWWGTGRMDPDDLDMLGEVTAEGLRDWWMVELVKRDRGGIQPGGTGFRDAESSG